MAGSIADPDKKEVVICLYCGAEYLRYKSRVRIGQYSKYCNPVCRHEYKQKYITSVRKSTKDKRRYLKYTTLKLYASIIEAYACNPNQSQATLAKVFNVNPGTVCAALTKYFKKPKSNITINSGIDTPRAIELERKLRLKETTEAYEFIDGY